MGGAERGGGVRRHDLAPIVDEPRGRDAAAGRRADARLLSVQIGSAREWQLELPKRRRGGSGRRAWREPEAREQLSCILGGGCSVYPAHWSRAAGAGIEVSGEDVPTPETVLIDREFFGPAPLEAQKIHSPMPRSVYRLFSSFHPPKRAWV